MARTPGSVVHTEDIIKDEVKQWSQVSKKIRVMIELQLKEFDKKIKEEGMSIEGHLQIMAGLKELLSTAVKVVAEGNKILQADKKPESEDSTSILQDLLK